MVAGFVRSEVQEERVDTVVAYNSKRDGQSRAAMGLCKAASQQCSAGVSAHADQ